MGVGGLVFNRRERGWGVEGETGGGQRNLSARGNYKSFKGTNLTVLWKECISISCISPVTRTTYVYVLEGIRSRNPDQALVPKKSFYPPA